MLAAAPPPTALALGTCLLLAIALVALARGFAAPSAPVREPTESTRAGFDRRIVMGVAVGFLVLLATRWLLLCALAGTLTALWGRLLHDRRADDERRKVEAIAKWLEDLRDTLRGSAVAAEEALEQVAARPPDAIAHALRSFVHRRRLGFRTEDSLADLADELAHPLSDAAIAAIRLVIGGSAGAGRLYNTVNALAVAARHEVTARERIDRTRAVYQASMKRLVVIGALLVGYLRVAGGELLSPYDTAVGQVVLVLPLGMWLGCVLWLRSLCRYEQAPRYRIAGSVEATTTTGALR
ncbi:MAG: hypothetical protein Q7V57_08040 [Actinomycetota bacterium]|nr:hypothetical protein [Actinomycetota bacterium]